MAGRHFAFTDAPTICCREGCSSAPAWRIGFKLYAPRVFKADHVPAPAETALLVCEEHRRVVTLEELLTDQGWADICMMFRIAGKVAPDRSLTELTFTALGSSSVLG